MRRILLGCAMATMMATNAVQAQSSPSDGYGAWVVSDETSPVDGTPNFKASLAADNTVGATRGRPKRPILAFFCDHDGLAVNIDWPNRILLEKYETNPILLWKVDDGALNKTRMDYAKQALIGSGKPVLALMSRWSAGKTLAVRVPDHAGGQDAVFHTQGLDRILARVDATGCGPNARAN